MSADRAAPPRVHWLVQREGDVPAGDAWLTPAERRVQEGLRSDVRRRAWRLGRWTAKSALGRWPGPGPAGLPPDAVAVLADEDGAPGVFLAGRRQACALSLSHRGGWGLAAVGPAGLRLGCDLEMVEPRSRAFVEDFFTPGEQRRLAAAGPGRRDPLANLVWSAKESALKALRTGLREDPRTLDVRLAAPDGPEGRWQPLCVRRRAAAALPGWWRRDGPRLVTLVAWPGPAAPVPVPDAPFSPGTDSPGVGPEPPSSARPA